MDRLEKAQKTTSQVKANIETLLEASKKSSTPACPQKAVVYLTQLNSIEMTWGILSSTRIGYTVNDLRLASSSANVRQRAKQLLKKWRGLQVQAHSVIKTAASVVHGTGAIREQNREISTLRVRTNTSAVTNVVGCTSTVTVPSTSAPGNSYDDGRDELRWSVRYAAEGGIGLKMIFAKRKHVPLKNNAELKRKRVV